MLIFNSNALMLKRSSLDGFSKTHPDVQLLFSHMKFYMMYEKLVPKPNDSIYGALLRHHSELLPTWYIWACQRTTSIVVF